MACATSCVSYSAYLTMAVGNRLVLPKVRNGETSPVSLLLAKVQRSAKGQAQLLDGLQQPRVASFAGQTGQQASGLPLRCSETINGSQSAAQDDRG